VPSENAATPPLYAVAFTAYSAYNVPSVALNQGLSVFTDATSAARVRAVVVVGMAQIEGWHVNVRHVDKAPELDAYSIKVKNQVRAWA